MLKIRQKSSVGALLMVLWNFVDVFPMIFPVLNKFRRKFSMSTLQKSSKNRVSTTSRCYFPKSCDFHARSEATEAWQSAALTEQARRASLERAWDAALESQRSTFYDSGRFEGCSGRFCALREYVLETLLSRSLPLEPSTPPFQVAEDPETEPSVVVEWRIAAQRIGISSDVPRIGRLKGAVV